LHLAQAQSNRGPRGCKHDFADAERLVKRLVTSELILSFVPDGEQRLWRTVTRTKYQLRRNRVQLQNRLEALLEEAHLKLSSLVSDLLGASARRMLKGIAEGESDPAALASLADQRLRATPEQLRDALDACQELNPIYRRLVKMALEELQLIDQKIGQLDQENGQVAPLPPGPSPAAGEVPGLGVDSAQQIIADAPRLPPWLREKLSPPGWEPARARRRRRELITAADLPRATVTCDVFSIRQPTLRSSTRGVSSPSSIGAMCHAWDTSQRLASLPIAFVA
jgi:transposase